MKYKYVGYNRSAQRVNGMIEASTPNEAKAKLRDMQISATSIKEGEGPGAAKGLSTMLGGSGKPTLKEFTVFIRQFSTMQSAGIPIVESIGILAEQTENKNFGFVLASIQKKVEEGVGLAEAMRQYPQVFERITVNLIQAGEFSGSLEAVLSRLSEYYEKVAGLRRKIISAATYPCLIIVLVVVILFVLLIFVVPIFQDLFKESGKELPQATQMIVDVSQFVRDKIMVFIGVAVGTVWGIIYLFKNPEIRKSLDPILLKVPLFGDLLLKTSVARFTRTLGTMIQSGVSIIEGLEITAQIAGNHTIETAIKKTRDSIKEGNSVSQPLAESGVFPKMVTSMIAIGEKTGAMEQMLEKIAEFYEEEVDQVVGALTSILEPVMIVIVGVLVAGVLIPLYLPVFKLGDLVG